MQQCGEEEYFLRYMFEDLKCSFCNKYLSVSPIFISTDGTLNKCGRCKDIITDKTFIPNKVYDEIARHFKFPCSESESCKEMLPWEKAANHERVCELRTILCPLDKCSQNFVVNSASDHFSENHRICRNNLFLYDLICDKGEYDVVLFDIDDAHFLAFFVTGQNYLRISVYALNHLNVQYKYTIGFISEKCSIDYNNFSSIGPYTGLPDFKIVLPDTFGYFKEDSLHEVLNVKKLTSNIKVKLIILKESESNLGYLNDSIATSLIDIINEALVCPICFFPMTSYIYFCQTGHSLCFMCKNKLDICPYCQLTFQSGRNLVLENLYQNFKPLNPFNKINEQ